MTELVRIDDALADLDSKFAALERGLVEYQQGVTSWTNSAVLRVSKNAETLDSKGKELADREALYQGDCAESERERAEALKLKEVCEARERQLNELAELLAQAERDTAAKDEKARAEITAKRADLVELNKAIENRQRELAERGASLAQAAREAQAKEEKARSEFEKRRAEFVELEKVAEKREHELQERATALAQAKQQLDARTQQAAAEFEQQRAETFQLKESCDTRERELKELAELLAQAERDAQGKEKKARGSEQQIEADRIALNKLTEELRQQQSQLDRQMQEQMNRERDLLAQTNELAKHQARAEKERTGAAELQARCKAQEGAFAAERAAFEKERTAFETERNRVRAMEASLQTDRTELSAAREAFGAHSSAVQIQLAHDHDQLDVKLEQARQHEKELQDERAVMERLKQEFERKMMQAAERESGLVAQQAKLESAITSIQNDRLTVQKARSMADEVAQARSDELAKTRLEADALRTEIAELRHGQDDLKKGLREACEAAKREATASTNTRNELQVALAQAESSKAAATETAKSEHQQQLRRAEAGIAEIRAELEASRGQRSKLEIDLVNALEARAQMAKKLDETRADLEQTGKNLEQERAQWTAQLEALKVRQSEMRLNQQNMAPTGKASGVADSPLDADVSSHSAVGTFWASKATSGARATKSEHSNATLSVKTDAGAQSAALRGQANGVQAPADMATAMQDALAAAHAEVNENQTGNDNHAKQRSRAGSKRSKTATANTTPASVKSSAKETAQPAAASNTNNSKGASPSEIPLALDAETLQKLKTLKRLNPHKSESELLAAINAAPTTAPVKPKPKRGWFVMK